MAINMPFFGLPVSLYLLAGLNYALFDFEFVCLRQKVFLVADYRNVIASNFQ